MYAPDECSFTTVSRISEMIARISRDIAPAPGMIKPKVRMSPCCGAGGLSIGAEADAARAEGLCRDP